LVEEVISRWDDSYAFLAGEVRDDATVLLTVEEVRDDATVFLTVEAAAAVAPTAEGTAVFLAAVAAVPAVRVEAVVLTARF
jgi:hypothetical protein